VPPQMPNQPSLNADKVTEEDRGRGRPWKNAYVGAQSAWTGITAPAIWQSTKVHRKQLHYLTRTAIRLTRDRVD